MLSSRDEMPRRSSHGRRSALAGLALLAVIATTGCQVEYAGMTLPSGKYMQDDVQYFAPGPDFPYANTQAATQRARMQAAGMPLPPPPGAQNGFGGPGIGGMQGGGAGAGIPRLNAAPEAENAMPGGASAPNNLPGPTPPVNPPAGTAPPGGAMPAPPG